MPRQHLVSTFESILDHSAGPLDPSRAPAEWLVHLLDMNTNLALQDAAADRHEDSLEPVFTLSELASRLGVSV